ncbi:MAG: mechanosensitive ion channel, partial [Epsilonproteobacteria bacterium]
LRAVVETNEKIKSIRTDHFAYTVQAIILTAMASLPIPLLLMTVGWQLSLAPEPTEFSNAVSAGLLRISPDFFYLLFFADLAIPDGVVARHFRWSSKITDKLHHELKLFMVLILPAIFITIYSYTLDSVGISGVLTLIGILSIIGSIGLFLYRTFTPGGGILAKYYKENADHLLVRLRFIWEKFFYVLIVLIVIQVLFGYIHTASVLTHNLFFTIWVIYTLALIRGLLARWLLLVNRRLEVQAILARREEARVAKEKEAMEENGEDNSEHDEPASEYDEPEVDLVDLGTKSRKLLHMLLLSGGAVGLWFIWSPILPAFNFLNDISLWSSVGLVDGENILVPVTLGDLILAIIVIIITAIASRGLPALLEFVLLQNKNTTVGGRYTATTLFRYLIVAVGTLLFFSIIGASWSQIQWLAAALSVGIGFGLQEIVANFISGLIILFERPIRVGDTVTVGTTTGTVTRIQIRATTITTWDKQELLVPNKEFITTQLLNWTLSDQIIRIAIPVGIAYGSDVPKAMKLLKEAATEHKGILKSPESFVAFESFGDNALQLTLRAYIPSMENRISTITELHESINHKFNEAGISIAFPQRDIHFDTSKPIDIRVQQKNDNEE